jgi:antibiotic biosynthesis monooxygenase (ABM) superfamily enzyme
VRRSCLNLTIRLTPAGILVWFSTENDEITEAFWSQTLTLYSVLVAAAISISETNLTKFHAIIASELVMSPLTIYLAVYSVVSSSCRDVARWLNT